MNIIKKIDQYNENYIYFCEPIKNNIMNESSFIRIIYSTPQFVLNGIYLLVILHDIICEKYYNKFKCIFNPNIHSELIDHIKKIEENIIMKMNLQYKTPQYKINEQLKNGIIKLFHEIPSNPNTSFLLKISGVWETQYSYGLTYKFIYVKNP